MTPTAHRILLVLGQCHIPGWELSLTERTADGTPTHMYLQVRCREGVCNVTGNPMTWGGRKWLLSPFMTDSEVVQTAFKAVLAAMEHEVREQFTFEGVAVMQPHRDLREVVRLAKTVSDRPGCRETIPGLAV